MRHDGPFGEAFNYYVSKVNLDSDPTAPFVGGDGKNRETAVLQLNDRRIGNGAEAPRVHAADDARLHPQKIGGANQILGSRQTAGQRELMAQLRGIGGDAVVARDQ